MAKSLILFIHGLGGNAADTWGQFPELLRADEQLKEHSIAHFSYPTFLFRLPFGRRYPRIQTLAEALNTQIELRYSDYREITLVAHSLGGLVGKQYLINQIENNRSFPVRRMLLYAVPSNGAGLASLADQLSWRHRQVAQLCRDSDLIRHLAEAWVRCKVPERIKVQYVVAALDRVVDEMSARESWGNQKIYMVVDRGHRDVVKPNNSDDIPYIILKKFLTEPFTDYTVSHEPLGSPVASFPGFSRQQVAFRAEIRVSSAALLKIEHDGQYLLVRSLHRKEQFAPFGGVYKYFPEALPILNTIEFKPQRSKSDMTHDLRGFLPGDNLERFKEWFEAGAARETHIECLQRELVEECQEAGVSPPQYFDRVHFRHVRSVKEGPLLIPAEGYQQYKRFDIYELMMESEEGRALIASFREQSRENPNLLWVTWDEIRKGRARTGQVVGSHAAYLASSQRYWDEGPSFPWSE